MKTKTKRTMVEVTEFVSSVCPDVSTTNVNLAHYISWADENPQVWQILRSNKSKAFGQDAIVYMGYQRGKNIDAVFERLRRYSEELGRDNFWGWRARFTLEHFKDKGFTSGFFTQHECPCGGIGSTLSVCPHGGYRRHCCQLDYTKKTLEEVLQHFHDWCMEKGGSRYPMGAILIDGELAKTYGRDPAVDDRQAKRRKRG